jgi:hypothetical protein
MAYTFIYVLHVDRVAMSVFFVDCGKVVEESLGNVVFRLCRTDVNGDDWANIGAANCQLIVLMNMGISGGDQLTKS